MNDSSPAAGANANTQRSFLRLATALGIAFFLLMVITGSQGWLARVLLEFEVSISPMSALALSVFLPVALVFLVVATVGVEIGAKGAASRNTWNAIAIGLGLVCLAIYTIGVSLPLLQLIYNLS